MNTALIIRPNKYPPPHVLECDGPIGRPIVNRHPGTNVCLYLGFDEWLAQPEHLKKSEPHPESIDYDSACRIARLIDNFEESGIVRREHLAEIRWRMEALFPCCTGDSILRQVKYA